MANKNIKLSILICSVENTERQESLNKLVHELNHQVCSNYAENIVEILVERDNGTMSVGKKRNVLIDKANGEYICFIDDDDYVAKNYLNLILQNLTKDILLIRIDHRVNGMQSKEIQPSLYIDNLETNELIFRANHLHLCPHLKLKASWVKFQEINFAEDLDYSQRLIPLIQHHDIITEAIYIYNDNLEKSLTRNV
jgi:glycosyltransferase involved in cell wall biosynthesis